MDVLQGTKAAVARQLFEVGAVKFGEFRLKLHETQPDAPLSPIYLNLRTDRHPKNPGPLTDEIMELIGDLFAELPLAPFVRFADIPEAGQPFGDQVQRMVVSAQLPASRLTLHKEVLPDGTRHITRQVDGYSRMGDSCLLVDELITQADSKLEAIIALEGYGLIVLEVLVLVDRMQGGRQQLEAAGYNLHSVFTLEELLAFYVQEDLVDQSKADQVLDYVVANQL
ncbi:hypothetical protein BH09PAT4_BH09PAT4_01360 [soil metagenome]